MQLYGQNCNIKVHGRILDEVTGAALPFATVYFEGIAIGQSADEEGYFQFDNLCPDSTHIRVSHVSCEPYRGFISIEKDTILNLFLHHHEELMDEVLVHANKNEVSTQNSSTIDKDLISRESNKSLGELLQEMGGVSALRTGSGLFKPIIHGLYGNRITILNNGIAQSGQQWGSDHAPEIDPFSADHISVIKGVGALEFSGSSLGGVVLIEPSEIANEPHLHGNFNYIFQTNGQGHVINSEVAKSLNKFRWRANVSLKGIGDQKSPDYFLTNTGRKEGNGSLQISTNSSKWKSTLYFSTFNTEIGILRGSHIGNLTDLESAFIKDTPFYTANAFNRIIDAPSQEVHHQLLKLKTTKLLSRNGNLSFQYAGQINNRKEFDVRRGGRSDTPALSLLQYTHFLEGNYSRAVKQNGLIKAGFQWDFKDNTNNPETGILPLIPDYTSHTGSGYVFYQKDLNNTFYEFGGRVDYRMLNVVRISRDLPRRIERFKHSFPNYSISAGLRHVLSDNLKVNLNGGYVLRAPAINELYSFGLHQGVSSIEVGNPELNSEKSLKFTASVDYSLNDKFYLQALGYLQSIQDYIFLRPSAENLLTIRGAFPLFNYSQTNARLVGADFLLSYEPFQHLRLVSKAAVLKGDDISNAMPLVYMPSNNISNTVLLSAPDFKKFIGNSFSLEHRAVFRQNHLNVGQDFVTVPDSYHIYNVSVSSSFMLDKQVIKFGVKMENALNTKYRDYLNRQRYFADELGRNISLRMNLSF